MYSCCFQKARVYCCHIIAKSELISNCFSNYKQFFLVILKNRAHDYCQLIGLVRFLTKNKNFLKKVIASLRL